MKPEMGTVSEQGEFNLTFLRCAAGTDVGMRRDENQDCFGVIKGRHFHGYFVADGMGGVHGGATASRLAISTLEELLQRGGGSVTPDALEEMAQQANARIFEKGSQDPSLAGMGTTLVGLVFTPTGVICLNVGDSRAYRVRGTTIQQLSEDHTLVRELVRSGALAEEEAEKHPVSHMLTRSLGPVVEVQIEADFLPEQPELGDIYILCSDGLYNLVSEEEMLGVVKQNPLDDANQILINLANQRGGPDNVTVLVVSVGERVGKGRSQEYRKARDRAVTITPNAPDTDTPADAEGRAVQGQAESGVDPAQAPEQNVPPPPVEEPADPRAKRQKLVSERVQQISPSRGVPVFLLVAAALVFGLSAGEVARRFGLTIDYFSSTDPAPSGSQARVTTLSDLSQGLDIKRDPSQLDLRLPEIARQFELRTEPEAAPPDDRVGASRSRDVVQRAVLNLEQQLKVLSAPASEGSAASLAAKRSELVQVSKEYETVQVDVESAAHTALRWNGRRGQLDEPNADIFKLANQLKAAGGCPEDTRRRLDRISDLSNAYQEVEGTLEVSPTDAKLRAALEAKGRELAQAREQMLLELRALYDGIVFKADSQFENLKMRRDSLYARRQLLQNEVAVFDAVSDPNPTKRNELRARLELQLKDLKGTLATLESRAR